MTYNDIKQLIADTHGPDTIVAEDPGNLQPSLTVRTDRIKEVCLTLRDHPGTYFDYLSCLSGVDYGLEENKLGVVYHLASMPYKTQLTLKVIVDVDRSSDKLPAVPSVSEVWRTADWHEREAYDLLGIHFEGHPDLRRILCVEDWEGHPLRKDYKTASSYKGIKIDY